MKTSLSSDNQSPEGAYYTPHGGLPGQDQLMTGRAVFTESYAVIPKGVMSDIVTSNLPHWTDTRAWIIARPLSGFTETFSHYIVEVSGGGGSEHPEPETKAQSVIFVVNGTIELNLSGETHVLKEGGYAYIPAGTSWRVKNSTAELAGFHWIRKIYEPVHGIDAPPAFVTCDSAIIPEPMPDTDDKWASSRFVDSTDIRHDMQVNIVTFQPGGVIPFEETHVMEHGLYVLQGKAVYKLNRDWVEVEAGDYMWLRAFCPQACYAGGPGPFRYLLYKDINRHARLRGFGGL